MRPYDFVHLVLLALNGEIQGKTKLQKTVYFFGVLTDNLANLGFRPHYYGPYSDEITHAVDSLRALNFLSQTTMGTGSRDIRGFEISRQDFKLTEEGKVIGEQKAQKYPDEWQKIIRAADNLRNAGDLDYMKMSIAAKTHFLKQEDQTASPEALYEKAKQMGWNPTVGEIQESTGFLQKLNLVR